MKFKHLFHLEKNDDYTYIFKENNLNIRIDFISHMIRFSHYKDEDTILPTFSVCPDNKMAITGRDKLSLEGFTLVKPSFKQEENKVYFETEDIKLEINLLNFEITYIKGDKVLFKDREYIAYNFEDELGEGSFHYVTREKEEIILGLGDKTGNINKYGRSFKLNTSDSMGFDARNTDPLYKHVPFYMCKNSIGTYGMYYDTYSNGEFDFGREINNYYAPYKKVRYEEENLIFYVIFGDIPEILHRFTLLKGKDFLPPLWTLKYCGSTMSYTDADDAGVQLLSFLDKCKEYEISPGGFYLSSGYTQIKDKRYVFHWNLDKIPSPEGLAKAFKDAGVEFLPNIKPAFLVDHPLYELIAKNGWFLHNKKGEPCIFPFWSDYGSYLDFTNPGAFAFWSKCVKENLVDKGYKNTWNDNNEYDIQLDDCYAYGFNGKEVKARLIKPLFSYLMTRASLEAQEDSIRKNAVSRCGMVGTSRIASTWTGDNRTSFEDFRYNHKMAMTMSLSGIYNFGQDIGGFDGPRPNKELFLRWIQYGLLTPRFVLHSWNSDGSSNMPWLYEEEKETVKKLFLLREELLPYLYNQVYHSVNESRPIIYPIFLKYPEYDIESDAYFFGDDILSFPVFDEGKEKVLVDLPENNGDWYLFDKKVKGKFEVKNTIHDLPTFCIKGGTVIATKVNNEIIYKIYPLEKGTFTKQIFIDDGVSKLEDNKFELIEFEVNANEKVEVKVKSKNKIKYQVIDGFNR